MVGNTYGDQIARGIAGRGLVVKDIRIVAGLRTVKCLDSEVVRVVGREQRVGVEGRPDDVIGVERYGAGHCRIVGDEGVIPRRCAGRRGIPAEPDMVVLGGCSQVLRGIKTAGCVVVNVGQPTGAFSVGSRNAEVMLGVRTAEQ